MLKHDRQRDWSGKTDLDAVPGLSRVRYGEIASLEGQTVLGVKQIAGDALGLGRSSVVHGMTIHAHDPSRNRIPLFYLPYRDDHNFRITLKVKDREPELRLVAFFITEAVDGCSVYVEGTRATPTAYHINASSTRGPDDARMTGKFDHDSRVWQAKWNHMDQRFRTEGTKAWTVQRAVGVVRASKVENDDYMIRAPGQIKAFMCAALQAMPKSVEGRQPQKVMIVTQGTVFGCFEPDGWHFYVQRRLQVVYLTATGGAAIAGIWVPLAVKEFWPTVETGRPV